MEGENGHTEKIGKQRLNEERIARQRFGKSFGALKPDEQYEILQDMELAFMEGDYHVGVSVHALSGKAYQPGRAGQELVAETPGGKLQKGETIRKQPPHGESKEGNKTHIPIDHGKR